MRFHPLFLMAAAPLLAGCPNTDTAVFVEPSVASPTLTVAGSALGASVSGGFTLSLHLGARASGPSAVSLGQFAIQDATQTADIVSPLTLDSGSTSLPVTVEPDSDVQVALTFDTGAKLLPADVKDKLCAAAGVVITGTLQDSLQDTSTPVDSAVIHASGCM
ncbi:MAG: hypothetical protein QM820_54295 [Minicystis sp.]